MISLAAAVVLAAVAAADVDEFKVKSEQVFEFAQKPQVTRQGDRVTIAFETKGFCDVTVAIEDAQGKIVRHFASGVLGPNAPAPFQKNSKSQTIVWDGKNDRGEYVDDRAPAHTDALTVRVSLGLKARFERTLYRSQVGGAGTTQFCAAAEGVYVVDPRGDHVSLLDHDGVFLRTVYPFPRAGLAKAEGLRWHEFPHGDRLPLKTGEIFRMTLLTHGWDEIKGEGEILHRPEAFAVRQNRIALAGISLNRLAADGAAGGLPLSGPRVAIEKTEGRQTLRYYPTSAAFSLDGRWLYLAGYMPEGLDSSRVWRHGVTRLEFAANRAPEPFAGQMDRAGAGNDLFTMPTSVACASQGRVCVSDYLNDRIQVFDPDGELLKTIPVQKPARICLHRRTQDIYVFSWMMRGRTLWEESRKHEIVARPALTHLGPLDAPAVKAVYDLPLMGHPSKYDAVWDDCSPRGGIPFAPGGPPSVWDATLDSWTDPPTIWLDPGSASNYTSWTCSYEQAVPRLLTPRDGKLVVKRDFGKEVQRLVGLPFEEPNLRIGGNMPLAFDPKSGLLYAGYWHSAADKYDVMFSYRQALSFDPETGKVAPVDFPLATSDLCFDLDGYAYLRRPTVVPRFDPAAGWREVPWDYGQDSAGGYDNCKTPLVGGLRAPGGGYKPQGGLYVSPNGKIVVPCYQALSLGLVDRHETPTVADSNNVKAYRPVTYKGRATGRLVTTLHVFDKYGRIVSEDVVKGLSILKGVALDRDDNIYVMHSSARMLDGQPYFRRGTGTLIKFSPKGGKIYSSKNTDLPLDARSEPDRPPDLDTIDRFHGRLWVEGARWYYAGGGDFGVTNLEPGCVCTESNFALDLFARSFVPEHDHYSVAVLDTNGNVMMRIGQYGNAQDGRPLVADEGPTPTPSIGGDEVALFRPTYVATHSDRRVFIADPGNRRILSVKLGYQSEAKVALKDVPEAGK